MEDTVAISHLLESKYPRSKPTLLALKKKTYVWPGQTAYSKFWKQERKLEREVDSQE